jgi:transcriptional regulator with XRE-family HTH domain
MATARNSVAAATSRQSTASSIVWRHIHTHLILESPAWHVAVDACCTQLRCNAAHPYALAICAQCTPREHTRRNVPAPQATMAVPLSALASMSSAPQLIADLITLVRPWGWTLADLAREIGVSEITLTQYRSGRRRLSMQTFAAIARRFKDQRIVRDLAWQYAAVEYYEERDAQPSAMQSDFLPPAVARTLRAYVDRFAEETIRGGRGLYLTSSDASSLSATMQLLTHAFDAAKIGRCALRADRKPSASEARAALAAPLLLVERADFLCPEVAELVRRRADLARPMVVTSMQPPASVPDAYLRRIFLSTTRLVDVGASATSALASPAPNSPLHASATT